MTIPRRCLGVPGQPCQAMITAGSRCPSCARAYRSPYSRHGWADAVKARDGYACTVRGCATPFGRVRAHHIRPLAQGGRDELSNGETLCYNHHQEEHR